MRSSRLPLALGALGVAATIASCTLITDVDRSRIPEGDTGGTAGAGTGGVVTATGGEGGLGGGAASGGSDATGGMAGTPNQGGMGGGG